MTPARHSSSSPRDARRKSSPFCLTTPRSQPPKLLLASSRASGFRDISTTTRYSYTTRCGRWAALTTCYWTLLEEIADEDPFAVLRLLQTCGISEFGHVLSAAPPALAQDFARERDEAITSTFSTIQQSPTTETYTHALPVGAGGAGLTSLETHAAGGYIGAFFKIAGPLQQRLTHGDGRHYEQRGRDNAT